MSRIPWLEKTFQFGTTEAEFANVIPRLEATYPKLRSLVNGLSLSLLTRKPEGKWSVLEHIGHLGDLEGLWQTRLEEFCARKAILSPADMENRQTHEAGHHLKSVDDLLNRFQEKRNQTLQQIRLLPFDVLKISSFHPRLKAAIVPGEHLYFAAEHDAHHIQSIQDLLLL